MRLNSRLAKLEGEVGTRPVRKPIPTESLEAFTRGWLAREFTTADIDPTNFYHTQLVNQLAIHLVTLAPKHQAWLEATPWAQAASITHNGLSRETSEVLKRLLAASDEKQPAS